MLTKELKIVKVILIVILIVNRFVLNRPTLFNKAAAILLLPHGINVLNSRIPLIHDVSLRTKFVTQLLSVIHLSIICSQLTKKKNKYERDQSPLVVWKIFDWDLRTYSHCHIHILTCDNSRRSCDGLIHLFHSVLFISK